jgi:hypothetical protein
MRSCQGHKNQRSDLKPLTCNSISEWSGYSFVGIPVTDVERLLGLIRLPGWPFFYWHIRVSSDEALFSPDYSPFDFVGVLLVNDDVELQEPEELAKFFREDRREILGVTTLGKSFTEAKHGFIAPPCNLRRSIRAFAGSEIG